MKKKNNYKEKYMEDYHINCWNWVNCLNHSTFTKEKHFKS